jgi:uncharacterized protein YjbI with pentapeptide repeats
MEQINETNYSMKLNKLTTTNNSYRLEIKPSTGKTINIPITCETKQIKMKINTLTIQNEDPTKKCYLMITSMSGNLERILLNNDIDKVIYSNASYGGNNELQLILRPLFNYIIIFDIELINDPIVDRTSYFTGADFSGADFTDIFINQDFTGTTLTNCIFANTELRANEAFFTNANLSTSTFKKIDLTRCDFYGVKESNGIKIEDNVYFPSCVSITTDDSDLSTIKADSVSEITNLNYTMYALVLTNLITGYYLYKKIKSNK